MYRKQAIKEIATVVVEDGLDPVSGGVLDWAKPGQLRPQPLTTDPSDWEDLRPFMEDSPVMEGAEPRIHRQIEGVRWFQTAGPCLSDSAPVYQLAVAA
jgi:hypothetical protein